MKLEIFLVLLLGFVNGAKILVWPAEWSHWINMKVRSLNSYPGITNRSASENSETSDRDQKITKSRINWDRAVRRSLLAPAF